MIAIDFLDHNIIDTLVLVNTIELDEIVVLLDSRSADGKRAKHFENALRQLSPRTKLKFIKIDTRNIKQAVDVIERIAGTAASDVYMNIDTDHGISMAASYGASDISRIIPICVDMSCGIIRNLKTLEPIAEIKHIKLKDFLRAIGAKHIDDSHEMPPKEEYDSIVAIAEKLFQNVRVWNLLCAYIGKHYSHNSYRIRIPEDLDGDASPRQAAIVGEQIKAFGENGFLRTIDAKSDLYEFTGARHRGYMLVFGLWLEMYVYIKLAPYLDDIHCGYVIDWDSMDDYDTNDNEIDVIGISKSRPILISCKMRMPTKEDIYEIGYISEMLGGSTAIPVVATTAIVDRKASYKPGLFPRFCKMNVELLETYRMRKGNMDEIMAGILGDE